MHLFAELFGATVLVVVAVVRTYGSIIFAFSLMLKERRSFLHLISGEMRKLNFLTYSAAAVAMLWYILTAHIRVHCSDRRHDYDHLISLFIVPQTTLSTYLK